MVATLELLSWSNPVFKSYVYWSGVLGIKMLSMSLLTGLQRFITMTFCSPEDAILPKSKVKLDEPKVERVRRAHRNDMENILVFFPVGLLYVLTNPSEQLAINLFRVVGISRIVHTVVYAVFVVPQPARMLAFTSAFLSTGYMAAKVIIHAM